MKLDTASRAYPQSHFLGSKTLAERHMDDWKLDNKACDCSSTVSPSYATYIYSKTYRKSLDQTAYLKLVLQINTDNIKAPFCEIFTTLKFHQ